ncbi:hypothetical protein E2986_13866, partial [Frieseomelitta varia]
SRKGTIVADTVAFAQRLVVTNDCSESLKVAVRKCLPRLISWWFLPVDGVTEVIQGLIPLLTMLNAQRCRFLYCRY